MTRLPISLENRSRPVNIAVALMVILVTVLLAAGCTNNSEIPFEFTGSTTVIAQGATSVSDLAAKGVENPESLNIPKGISRFDLVTINLPAINEKLKSGQEIPVRIRGKDYVINVTRMTFDKNDDGIDSYSGKIEGVKSSEVLFTVGPKVIIGRCTTTDETFWINPAGNRSRAESSLLVPHYIYSTKDVEPHSFIIDRGTVPVPSVPATSIPIVRTS
jgi:hypothetical protein